jgi:outer membrane protein assembly factor BamB
METVIMKRPVKSTFLLLICILMLPIFVGIFNIKSTNCDPATDWWSMFRHDLTHSGYSTSIAPTTNQTLWSYTTGSYVDSSPAVVDDVVFVGSGDSKVYALNASDGSVVWSYTTGDYVWSSPAVVDGVVFVGSGDSKVYALNASDGSVVWSYTAGSYVFSSPAVVDGVVFVGSGDGKVYAFATPDVMVVGEISQTSYIESFLVPTLLLIGISGAIVMLGFAYIKRSKQTRSKPYNA